MRAKHFIRFLSVGPAARFGRLGEPIDCPGATCDAAVLTFKDQVTPMRSGTKRAVCATTLRDRTAVPASSSGAEDMAAVTDARIAR